MNFAFLLVFSLSSFYFTEPVTASSFATLVTGQTRTNSHQNSISFTKYAKATNSHVACFFVDVAWTVCLLSNLQIDFPWKADALVRIVKMSNLFGQFWKTGQKSRTIIQLLVLTRRIWFCLQTLWNGTLNMKCVWKQHAMAAFLFLVTNLKPQGHWQEERAG